MTQQGRKSFLFCLVCLLGFSAPVIDAGQPCYFVALVRTLGKSGVGQQAAAAAGYVVAEIRVMPLNHN
jgi:hypothetical protein